MPLVTLPGSWTGLTGGNPRCAVAGHTVQQCLDNLVAVHPGLAQKLFGDGFRIASWVVVYLGDTQVPRTAASTTPVHSADTLLVVPLPSGS